MAKSNGTSPTNGVLESKDNEISTNRIRVVLLPTKKINVPSSFIDGKQSGLIDALAESIQEIGLINPIQVLQQEDGEYYLLSGYHRLKAFEKLKRTKISCHVVSFDEILNKEGVYRRLSRFEENLVRKHLLVYDIAEHLGECKEIYEEIYEGTKQGGNRQNPKMGSCPPAYIDKSAEFLGKSRSTAGRYLQIWNNLIKEYPKACRKLRMATVKCGEDDHDGLSHPILDNMKDLITLGHCREDIPELIDLLIEHVQNGKFISLSDAKKKLFTIRSQNEGKGDTDDKDDKSKTQNRQNNTENRQDDEADGGAYADTTNSDEDTQDSEQNHSQNREDDTIIKSNHNQESKSFFINQFKGLYEHIVREIAFQNFSDIFVVNQSISSKDLSITITCKGLNIPSKINPPKGCPGFGFYLGSEEPCSACLVKDTCIDHFDVYMNEDY